MRIGGKQRRLGWLAQLADAEAEFGRRWEQLGLDEMTERVMLGDASDVPDDGLKAFDAGGISVVVARIGGRYCAVDSKCPHRGGNLGRGKLEGGAVVCPVHGSRFDMCSGEVLEWAPNLGSVRLPRFARRLVTSGSSPQSARTHVVEEDGGKLYLAD